MTLPIDRRDLPSSLDDWIDRIGLEPVWRLVQRYGGTPLYIPTPERFDPDHEVAQLIGYEPALELCRLIRHGDYVLVPNCRGALRLAQTRRMLKDLETDSIDTVALRYGVHRRTVFRAMAAANEGADDGQQELFDD